MTVNIWKSYIWIADKDVNMKTTFYIFTIAQVLFITAKIEVFTRSSNIWLSYT